MAFERVVCVELVHVLAPCKRVCISYDVAPATAAQFNVKPPDVTDDAVGEGMPQMANVVKACVAE